MKNRMIGVCLLFAFSWMGVYANPVTLETAKKTAEEFYRVQMPQVSKSVPALSCVYPKDDNKKSTDFVPYYIFNAEREQGFVIVAGDDNVSSLVLGYSDKGTFEIDNMPDNLRYWLGCYTEGVKKAAESGGNGTGEKYSFSKAKVLKKPLLDSINYNQDAPYNDLCPDDPTTNKRSYTGCVATALASIARYYEYPEKGENNITYTTEKGLNLSLDFTQSTYDWNNMLKQYDGKNLSEYSEEQRTAVATLMRDMGYAVKMNYGSNASGAYRDNTINGIVTYMGFDSVVNYREREDYDNDDQWISVLKDNLDNDLPVYYTGQGDGGGHAFVCDGYDDADFFHFNWGWGGSSNGYFVVRNLDPDNISGIGAGTGGGYTSMQGILHNMVPRGHTHSTDLFLLKATGGIEPDQVEDSLYLIGTTPLTVKLGSIKNNAMSMFKGFVALAVFQNGEFIKILSQEESIEIVRRGTTSLSTVLTAKLEGLQDGDYEIWAVERTEAENSEWFKVYATKGNRYTNDSYIPVRIRGNNYELLKTRAKVMVSIESPDTRGVSMFIYAEGEKLGSAMIYPSAPQTFDIKYGTYEFRFWTRNYDTSYVRVTLTKDTSLNVIMREKMLPPYIRVFRISNNTVTMQWLKEHPQGEVVFPTGYVIYLDSVEVSRVSSSTTEYVYTDIPIGNHVAGVRSIFRTGESSMSTRNFTIRMTDNETAWPGVCRISPNPSSNGFFMLEVDRDCRLQVCALSGNVLFERSLAAGSHQVDMGGYSSGVYLFRLSGRNGESALLKAVLK
ncbi:MAG: C10 family peptidase [Bacteroides sp.]|nr:C10 family peptidase [Bacteroides sp.]MCM1086338.1 C10 family peptidase [Bacteroides sp.]